MADHPAEQNDQKILTEGAAAYADPGSSQAAVTRGMFLTKTGLATIGIGGLIGVAIGVPVGVAALAPAFETRSYHEVNLGPASNFTGTKEWQDVTFETDPKDESGIYRRLAYVRSNGGDDFTVISNTCMHLGCPVQTAGTGPTAGFACPCHGGQYDSEGRRTAGPPVRPLNRYDARVENGNLILGRLYAVDNKLKPHQLKGPGQPVDGILSYLYPNSPQ